MTEAQRDEWRRPGPTAEQRRIDLWIGLAVTGLALVSLTLARSTGAFLLGPPPSGPEQLFWTVAVTLPLVGRRRWPAATLLVVAVAFIAAQARSAPESQFSSWALFCALYTMGAWGRDHQVARRLRIGVIATMLAWLGVYYAVTIDHIPPGAFDDAVGPVPPVLAAMVNGVLVNVLVFGFAYFFGETAWVAARREHELREQATELRRSQAEGRERAVLGERVRIARELHDVVAHHVSVMGVQASACRRVFDRDQDLARTALAAIEQSARTAVDELRRMLGVLRASGDSDVARSAPGDVARIGELVERARAAGLRATLGVYGEPVALPESVSQAAYRVTQEAVTNTLKHAGADLLDVRVRYLAREVEVDVTDDGRTVRRADTPGLGLIGMRERVTAHDGELEAGPRAGGGWRVRARFPLADPAIGRQRDTGDGQSLTAGAGRSS
ncbi:sensor histidine kinase [Micromonospora lupini]|uniref:histidine kinase n=1 Tax=Micromonospora lupini str. Lupac 08 TaxID=1150864 RepID=I0L0Z1_9ACTN|nr:sensor histidine kinase [Micromonospora lupini]CCH17488.1 Two-component histidine kinase dimerization and phosphoacceptor region [Micromonospora lupini str. Lupac 08]